jgi:Ni,Fe-hydrogenase III component G
MVSVSHIRALLRRYQGKDADCNIRTDRRAWIKIDARAVAAITPWLKARCVEAKNVLQGVA